MGNDQYGGQQRQAESDQQLRQDQQRDPKVSHGSRSESQSVSQMAASVGDAAGDAADLVKKKAHDVREMADEKAEALATWIKERPITSVLIGAAVGYLLGKMARR